MDGRKKASASRVDREIGLPAMLSVGGLLVAVLIAGSAGMESWFGDAAPTAPQATAAVVEPQDAGSDLYRQREEESLRAIVETLEIKVEQLTATNERLARQLKDLEEQVGPLTASVPRPDADGIDHGINEDRKADRVSVQFRTEREVRTAAAPSQPVPPAIRSQAPAAGSGIPDTVRTTQTLFALRFPSFRTIGELTAAWNSIRRRSGRVLVGLEPRAYAERDEQVGVVYRLLAGPIRNAGDAAVRCVRLGEIGIPCETAVFAGERLSTAASN